MTGRDNFLKAVHFDRPEYIPAAFVMNEACWFHYDQERIVELFERHPALFPGYKRPELPFTPRTAPFATAGVRYTDPWRCVWETAVTGLIGTVVEHPLASWDNFEGYTPPCPDTHNHQGPVDWDDAARQAALQAERGELPSFGIGHNHTWLKLTDIRGYENAVIDMAQEEPRLVELLDMLEAFNAGLLENALRRCRPARFGFAEDLGMQQGPMMSADHFARYIRPSYQRLMGRAREAGCVVHVHTDGDIRALADDLDQCPIDVLNIQDLVNGIDWIAARYRGRKCIELDIDRQHVTVHGTPADVDAVVREGVEKIGTPEGGLMLIYGWYPGTPIENAGAVMDAMERYAGYFA